MKGLKKAFAGLLCLLLAIQIGPFSAFADEEDQNEPSNGEINLPVRDAEYYENNFLKVDLNAHEDSVPIYARDIDGIIINEDGSITLPGSGLVFRGDGYYENELMVYTAPGVDDAEVKDILQPLESAELLGITGFDEIGLCFFIRLGDAAATENAVEILRQDGRVEAVELHSFIVLEEEIVPIEDGLPSPDSTDSVRLRGTDAAGTSAAIAAEAFSSAGSVIIARDDDFSDAMSATGFAGTLDAPILLTNRTSLSPDASATIDSLGATHAYIIGGAGAILPEVANALSAKGMTVERVYGSKAWDTSVACAQKISQNGGSDEDVAIVTTSMNFQDAVSVSSYAYSHKVPVFLQTQTGSRPLPDAATQMIGLNSTTQIFVLGGNGAVNLSTVEDVFGASRVTRLKGLTSYDTSNAIAEFMVDTDRLSANTVSVASGAALAKGVDSLSGSALAGKAEGVMLLVSENAGLGEPTNYTTLNNFLQNHSSEVNKVYMLGGRSVIPESVELLIASILN